MKRLAYIIGELGLGGSEQQLFQILKAIDQSQYHVHVFVLHPSQDFSFQAALESLGICVETVPSGNLLQRLWFIYRRLRQIRPDLVHSWSYYTNPYAGIAGFFAGVPLRFGSLRGSLTIAANQYSPLKHFFAQHSVQKIICNSQFLRQELITVDYPAERILVLPNCINSPIYAEASPTKIAGDLPVVGIIGNLRPEKNQRFFVEAVLEAQAQRADFIALIIGQAVQTYPEIEAELVALIGTNERILLLGFREDTANLLQRMAIFCLSSDSESLPNVILEAMAAGKPVIARRVGGIPELVSHNETGYLVDKKSEMAERILELLENPAQAQAFGLKGQQKVETFMNCQTIAERLCQIYFSQ